MQKVAFYLNNSSLSGRDYTSILDGNPGVGGSEYEFMLVPFLLQDRKNNIIPYLITNCEAIFPHKNTVLIKNLYECCDYCVHNGIDEVVVDIKHFDKNVLDIFAGKLNIIIWAHNNVPYSRLKLFWKLDYIKKIVNCGREELELYRDHITTLKSTYIYNIFPFKNKQYYSSRIDCGNNHNVVYMGSLVETKGFHVLAKAWKNILRVVPDAQLYVIGSGRLYNQKAKLGKYGIAEKKYEDLFMRNLLDTDGNILESVHFLGLLGIEKYEIMGKCKVAVPNPTGFSECLPITSKEMQLMGCNIVTIEHPAYLDTVKNKKYLYERTSMLAEYVASRLTSDRDDINELYDFVSSRFGIESNIQRWEHLILNINEPSVEVISEFDYQHKKVKDALLKYKINHRWSNNLPCIEQWYLLLQKINGKFHQVYDLLIRHYYSIFKR